MARDLSKKMPEDIPELIGLLFAEAGGKVHRHAVLVAHGEERVVLFGQGAAAVRHSIRWELER